MSIIDFTRSSFTATAFIWTDEFPPEVGSFVSWREGGMGGVTYASDSTFLGIVLSTRPLRREDMPNTTEVIIALAGEVYSTMYEADQYWEPRIAATREHTTVAGVLRADADEPYGPIDIEVTDGPGPNNPFVAVKFDTTSTLPQEFLDERVGITIRQE